MTRRERAALWCAIGLVGVSAPVSAQATLDGYLWPPPRAIRASAQGAVAEFGGAVALVGDVALVGAPRGVVDGVDRGFVRVAVRTRVGGDWLAAPDATLSPPGLSRGARFGAALAAAPGLTAVGAPRADGPGGALAGVVHLFALDDDPGRSRFLARLAPPPGSDGAAFGSSLAIDRRPGAPPRIAVGAPYARDVQSGTRFAGAVFVFVRDGERWVLETTMRAPVPGVAAGFGTSLAFAGETLVVGAPGDGATAPGAGRVFGFDRRGRVRWELAPRASREAPAGARYGTSLCALDDSTLAIGVRGRDAVEIVHLRAAAPLHQTLLRGEVGSGFGVALAGVGDDLLVGAPFQRSASSRATRPGAVRRFRRRGRGWSLVESLQPRPATDGGEFGLSVAAAWGTDGVARTLIGEPTSDHACPENARDCGAGRAVVLSLL